MPYNGKTGKGKHQAKRYAFGYLICLRVAIEPKRGGPGRNFSRIFIFPIPNPVKAGIKISSHK